MSSKKQNTIAHKVYSLLLRTIPVLNRFPRNQKFTLGDRIQNQLSDLLELYVHAYYAPKAEKKELLVKANIQLEIIRNYFRLGYDLGLYASTQYQYFAEVYPVKLSFAVSQGAT